ncbi:MAG: hypothetical protein GTN35_00655 [Nitrososphaeria archaeon]|nr:hypothetical protein [Nitrosopumilaceae archaeon]NIP10521.1 hypothetical protein [Nitrosopumilaceae archaeon]NIP90931.1 hypothetical protein [Nitrososphaeria archaeon]NIS94547.1 hypothetical protein [Nitrosopumilaceae archaeon]
MLSFKIEKLDIFQSYFFGKVEFRNDFYKINVQNQKRGKVLKLPFPVKSEKKQFIVRFTGPNDLFVEDFLPYCGESEWLEIDSDAITYFLADHQDKLDTIEIMDD